jgi:hypothetical protein
MSLYFHKFCTGMFISYLSCFILHIWRTCHMSIALNTIRNFVFTVLSLFLWHVAQIDMSFGNCIEYIPGWLLLWLPTKNSSKRPCRCTRYSSPIQQANESSSLPSISLFILLTCLYTWMLKSINKLFAYSGIQFTKGCKYFGLGLHYEIRPWATKCNSASGYKMISALGYNKKFDLRLQNAIRPWAAKWIRP